MTIEPVTPPYMLDVYKRAFGVRMSDFLLEIEKLIDQLDMRYSTRNDRA